MSYLTTQAVVHLISGGSTGSYLHYFTLMLAGQDIVYSLIKTVIFVWIASTVQCYYGFYATVARKAWELLPDMPCGPVSPW